MFLIRFEDLEEQGLSRPLIRVWFTTAKNLCKKQLLYVTMNNKLPIEVEDIVGYVSDIHITPRRPFITVKVDTFDDIQNDVITDAREFVELMDRGCDFHCQFGKYGKYITLIKTQNWNRPRIYVVKD